MRVRTPPPTQAIPSKQEADQPQVSSRGGQLKERVARAGLLSMMGLPFLVPLSVPVVGQIACDNSPGCVVDRFELKTHSGIPCRYTEKFVGPADLECDFAAVKAPEDWATRIGVLEKTPVKADFLAVTKRMPNGLLCVSSQTAIDCVEEWG